MQGGGADSLEVGGGFFQGWQLVAAALGSGVWARQVSRILPGSTLTNNLVPCIHGGAAVDLQKDLKLGRSGMLLQGLIRIIICI